MEIGKSRALDLNNILHDFTFDVLVNNIWSSVNLNVRTSVSELLDVFSVIILIAINKE